MFATTRNQLPGKVSRIKYGLFEDTVEVELGGGDKIVAEMASEGARSLCLTAGSKVIASIRAPWVVADAEIFKLSARNQLCGTIERLAQGKEQTELTVKLKGDNVVTASISNKSAETLQVGQTATVVIKASHIMLTAPEGRSSLTDV